MDTYSVYFRSYDDAERLSVSYVDSKTNNTHRLKMTKPGVFIFATDDLGTDIAKLQNYGIAKLEYMHEQIASIQEEVIPPSP